MKPKKLAKIMKALSNENRLALYMEIAKREQTNYEAPECNIAYIVQMFDLSKATISHHLKELSNADLITTEKRGKFLVATINKETLAEVKGVLGVLIEA
jgi:DNA-binding transcriptional ArsR family regulator